MNQRRGLGRGLGALIPSGVRVEPAAGPTTAGDLAPAVDPGPRVVPDSGAGLSEITGVRYAELALDQITPNPRQPRTVFDEDALLELVHSIREVGLLQPIVVRAAGPGRYELVAGERRWRAASEAGLDPIPAIVRDTGDDDLLRDALLENLHRAQLNALEEAAAYQQLLEEFGCTHEELAGRIGRPSAGQQHAAAAPAARGRAAAGRSRGAVRGPRARAARPGRRRGAGPAGAAGRGRGSVRAPSRRSSRSAADGRPRPRTPRPRGATAPGLVDLADRLSERLETRVRVETRQGQGQGHHRVRHPRRPAPDRRPHRPLTPPSLIKEQVPTHGAGTAWERARSP